MNTIIFQTDVSQVRLQCTDESFLGELLNKGLLSTAREIFIERGQEIIRSSKAEVVEVELESL